MPEPRPPTPPAPARSEAPAPAAPAGASTEGRERPTRWPRGLRWGAWAALAIAIVAAIVLLEGRAGLNDDAPCGDFLNASAPERQSYLASKGIPPALRASDAHVFVSTCVAAESTGNNATNRQVLTALCQSRYCGVAARP